MIAEGQIYGGALHGLGGALYEELAYDDNGQLLTGTFMDYLVPTASEAPQIDIAHIVSPSPLTPLGSKGLGESSSMTVPAVIANAVSDALAPLGIRINELPMTPSRLWQAMDRARRSQARSHNPTTVDRATADRATVDRATVDRAGRSPAASEAGHPRSKPASRTPLQ
jgi:2-furoyl-CoA dehydrogenase large subunit